MITDEQEKSFYIYYGISMTLQSIGQMTRENVDRVFDVWVAERRGSDIMNNRKVNEYDFRQDPMFDDFTKDLFTGKETRSFYVEYMKRFFDQGHTIESYNNNPSAWRNKKSQ